MSPAQPVNPLPVRAAMGLALLAAVAGLGLAPAPTAAPEQSSAQARETPPASPPPRIDPEELRRAREALADPEAPLHPLLERMVFDKDPTPTLGMTPPPREGLELVEKVGQKINLQRQFIDHRGRAVPIGSFFGQGARPVLMAMIYFRCPLQCPVIIASMVNAVSQIRWSVGEEYNVVFVTFDPTEREQVLAERRRDMLTAYGRSPTDDSALLNHWGVLGDLNGSAKLLAEDLGFPYKYLPDSGEYSHGTVIFVLQPDGTISRYIAGVPLNVETVRMALLEASEGKLGGLLGRLAHYCFVWDPTKGAYVLGSWRLMQIGAVVSALAVAGMLGAMLLLERRRRRARLAAAQADGLGHLTEGLRPTRA
jgi:protein SCO1/2